MRTEELADIVILQTHVTLWRTWLLLGPLAEMLSARKEEFDEANTFGKRRG